MVEDGRHRAHEVSQCHSQRSSEHVMADDEVELLDPSAMQQVAGSFRRSIGIIRANFRERQDLNPLRRSRSLHAICDRRCQANDTRNTLEQPAEREAEVETKGVDAAERGPPPSRNDKNRRFIGIRLCRAYVDTRHH